MCSYISLMLKILCKSSFLQNHFEFIKQIISFIFSLSLLSLLPKKSHSTFSSLFFPLSFPPISHTNFILSLSSFHHFSSSLFLLHFFSTQSLFFLSYFPFHIFLHFFRPAYVVGRSAFSTIPKSTEEIEVSMVIGMSTD